MRRNALGTMIVVTCVNEQTLTPSRPPLWPTEVLSVLQFFLDQSEPRTHSPPWPPSRFADCGLVCLAVPHDQRPPAPTLRVTPRADGRFDIAIQAIGFCPELLKALQPNVLGGMPGMPDAAPPEFRLRRTQGTRTEALYAREVSRGMMTIEAGGDGSHWSVATIDGPNTGSPPFVNFTWFAEVRYPAEIGRQVGAVEVPSDITPDGGAVAGDLESPWSEASLPQTAMLVPPPPVAPDSATVIRVPGGAQIDIPNPPVAPPGAVVPYGIKNLAPRCGQTIRAPIANGRASYGTF
jgi:hypothetical protein